MPSGRRALTRAHTSNVRSRDKCHVVPEPALIPGFTINQIMRCCSQDANSSHFLGDKLPSHKTIFRNPALLTCLGNLEDPTLNHTAGLASIRSPN
jgi:hypothetical protein